MGPDAAHVALLEAEVGDRGDERALRTRCDGVVGTGTEGMGVLVEVGVVCGRGAGVE